MLSKLRSLSIISLQQQRCSVNLNIVRGSSPTQASLPNRIWRGPQRPCYKYKAPKNGKTERETTRRLEITGDYGSGTAFCCSCWPNDVKLTNSAIGRNWRG